MRLGLADALQLGRVQAVDLPAALFLALRAYPPSEIKRSAKNVAQRLLVPDPSCDVALDAIQEGSDLIPTAPPADSWGIPLMQDF